jgi:uncharacterized protein (UPF0147 family)
MVLGDPGAGKSTLLRYLALVAAHQVTEDGRPKTESIGHPSPVIGQERRLPILIPLRHFAASGEALVDFLYTYAKQTYQLELPRGFFERALDTGRCLVLFDGLDEVTASDQRVEVRDAVAAFATRYSKNRFVVTSRIIGYESAPLDRRTFAHHTILPFNASEIEMFIEKWYAARGRDAHQAQAQAEHLIRTIRQNDRLKKLAENPLMLTIIALVHRIETELPNERVKLYDKCTEALLSTWEGVKGIPYDRERPHYKQRRRLLERLAFWMHTLEQAEERQAEVKRGDLELKLTDLLCEDEKLGLGRDAARTEAQAFIELAKSRTGILVERGDGIFSFVHLTFQEYFAACDLEARYVHNLDALWQQIQPHLYEARWREVILLLLGRLNRYDEPPNVIFEKILREHDQFDDVIHRNLFLAAQCLADGISIRERLRNDVVDALLKFARAKRPKYAALRDDAIVALGTLRGNVRAGEGLLALAQDEKVEAWVRGAAAEALGELGRTDDAVIQGLLALAQDEKVEAWVRDAAAAALGKLGRDDDAVRILLALAQDEKVEAWVRGAAAAALGKLGRADDAVRILLALAQDEKVDALVRRAAAEALGKLGRADDAARILLALAQDEKVSKGVRRAAAEALGKLGRADDAVIQGLLALAQDEKVWEGVRRAAAEALGKLGRADDTVIQGLLALAQDEKVEAWVRGAAAEALGALGRADDMVIQGLLALAQDEKVYADVRCAAAEALGKLGRADDAMRILLALAQDENVDEWVRGNAAEALGKLGRDDDAVRILLALAQDEKVDWVVQYGAAEALGKLGRADDTVIQGLLALAQDEKVWEDVRVAAAEALGNVGKKLPQVALALLKLAGDKDADVRDAAYRALKEVVGGGQRTGQ